jgi:hypothetical protein
MKVILKPSSGTLKITFIRDAQYRNIGKPNNLKVFGSNKPKGLNRMPQSAEVTYV